MYMRSCASSTSANEACGAGRVQINGRPAKSAAEVKEGDVLDILMGGKHFLVRITSVREHAGKADASEMYEVISKGE